MASKKAWTHDNVNNKSVDWYTPPTIFEDMDVNFDLDPCHPVDRIEWIPVDRTFNIEDDGLTQPWNGFVWMNPPYGKYTKAWLEKMHKHRNGVALVFARTDTQWYHQYVKYADAILFINKRVKFVDGLGKTAGSGAGSGSMLIAWGEKGIQALKNYHDKNDGHLIIN